jgi:hypothetical protein
MNDPVSIAKLQGAGAPEEITLEMSDAGSLALSRIKDDVADGSVSLRDAVELIYRAMWEAGSSVRSIPPSTSQFRQLLPIAAYREMSRTARRSGSVG